MIPAIEQSYRRLLGELDAHFRDHDFLFGGRPSIGDFGLIGPMYAHLYRDPYPGKLMRETAPNVAAWVERMQSPEPVDGDFLADDGFPPHCGRCSSGWRASRRRCWSIPNGSSVNGAGSTPTR